MMFIPMDRPLRRVAQFWQTAFRLASVVLLASSYLASAQSTQRTILAGHQPAVVGRLQPLARLDGSWQLNLSLHLPLLHQEALTSFLAQLYDPASPRYHHFLTPDEFDARFGPTAADYQALIDFVTRSGFTITDRHASRMLLQVSAPVTSIERAFQVKLRTYAHPREPRTFFAPDAEPSVEAGIPISYIGGLDNYSRPRPQNFRHSPLNSPAAISPQITAERPVGAPGLQPSGKISPQIIGSGPNGNLAGLDYRAAYAPGVGLTGAGQSVGLVEFDGFYPGDITSYESQTGLTNIPLQTVLLDGFNGVPTTGVNSANGEVALDIEMAISMAPGLASVVVFEDIPANETPPVTQPNNVLHAMSTNAAIKQFSCSWFFPDITAAQRTNMDGYFLKFAAQGQSFFVASGDGGAATGAIGAPDDDPYITLVGGTVLATAGPGGPWLSETAWNAQEGPDFNSSGGGISTTYAIPAWQKGVNMTANHGSTTKRNAPDVAMAADNIFLVADHGQQETSGGTSAASPLWAGFAALVNQQAVSAGLSPIGFVNPALYHLGTNSSFHACFDDVTVGNNTNTIATQFLAVPGYDLCTGWGSPSGGSLSLALAQPDGFQITPGRGLVANGPAGGPFTVLTQTLSLTNTGKPAFNWSLGCTSVWLNVSTNKGILTAGGGATNVTLSLNSAASLLSAGVYTANVWFTNLTSGLAQLRQFSLQVGQDLVLDGGFEAGDLCYWNLTGANTSIYTNNFVDFTDDTNGVGYLSYAGENFAALGQISTLAYLSQPLPTRAGQFYVVSLWLENPTGATPNQFEVQWNTNATAANIIYNRTNLGAFGYSNLFFVVQAATNLTTLKLAARNDNGFFALDNVSVQPVPAPAIQTSAAVNQAMQFGWNAIPGLQYQVQYKTNLLQTSWFTNLGNVTATTNPMMFTNVITTNSTRFYRVEFVP